MSLKTSREAFEAAYTRRSRQTWEVEPESTLAKINEWSSGTLIIASSPDYGHHIVGLLDHVVYRHSYLPLPEMEQRVEALAGQYKGVPISVIHLGITPGAFGASYMDMAIERLRQSRVRRVVVLGELSALQSWLKVGNLVIASSAIRDDDSHLSYADADVPAMADAELSWQLEASARASGRATYLGVCWSCGAGAGIFDPALCERAFDLQQTGILGNALEAATAYLLGNIIGLRVASLWLVADSLYEPITWRSPSPRLGWQDGWDSLVKAGLETLVLATK